MKSFLTCFLAILLPSILISQVYPPPSCIIYSDGQLTICPPDSVPGYSGGLLGYNVYMDDEFISNLPAGSPEDTVTMTFDPLPLPGNRFFCATANYLNWISDQTCDSNLIYYGYDLPFTEDWSSGSFETNNWIQEGDYWIISTETGEPMPSAKFYPTTILTDYFVPLTSYSYVADTSALEFVLVEFDCKLESITNTGNEMLILQYWKWNSQTWHSINCGGFTNEDGSFDWKHSKCKFTSLKGGPFMIRFAAYGESSSDVSAWYIDNINILQDCGSVSDLTTTINEVGEVELEWELKSGCIYCYGCWIGMYNPQYNYSNSVGTGSQVEFDVAHFWTPEMISDYEGKYITAVEFFPAEPQATYSIRIWEGDSANLVYEQAVTNPLMSQWNEVCLDTVHPVDITQNLWIGYHVDAMTGYPAGVDDGPSFDGFGNMMYFEGQWSTLKEINPELDFNWLIDAYVNVDYPMQCSNNIYKKVGDGLYTLIAKVASDEYDEYYTDTEVDLTQLNCYKVTNYTIQHLDTCESEQYGESCVLPVTIQEPFIDDDLQIFPNPASDEIFINSSSEINEIQMIDVTGRIIFIERNLKPESKIDVSLLNEGIYLIKISFNDKLAFRKVLIN
jgi:hypothetical protein